MIRLLSLLFVASLCVTLYLRFGASAEPDAEPGPASPASPVDGLESLADLKRRMHETAMGRYPMLPVRSVGHGLPDSGEWRGKPALRDLDGDGHLDVVVSIRRFDKVRIADGIRAYRGDGAGNWQLCDTGLSKDMGYGGSDAADLNGDGRPDIVYSGHDLPPRAFLNFLAFEGQDQWVPLDPLKDLEGISCSDVALGDYDGDGAADLAIMGFFPKAGGLYVYRNDGTGAFEPKQELMEKAYYGAIVRFEDVDGDGRPELIAATSHGPTVWHWRDAKWVEDKAGLPTTFGVGEVSGITRGIAALDLDGDGSMELAVSGLPNGEHKSIELFRRGGERWQAIGRGLPVEESCFDVVFARLPNGGKGMFLAAQHGVLVVRCAADGGCEVVGRIAGTEGVLNVGAGDVDGDGVDEVLALQQRRLDFFAVDYTKAGTEVGVR